MIQVNCTINYSTVGWFLKKEKKITIILQHVDIYFKSFSFKANIIRSILMTEWHCMTFFLSISTERIMKNRRFCFQQQLLVGRLWYNINWDFFSCKYKIRKSFSIYYNTLTFTSYHHCKISPFLSYHYFKIQC